VICERRCVKCSMSRSRSLSSSSRHFGSACVREPTNVESRSCPTWMSTSRVAASSWADGASPSRDSLRLLFFDDLGSRDSRYWRKVKTCGYRRRSTGWSGPVGVDAAGSATRRIFLREPPLAWALCLRFMWLGLHRELQVFGVVDSTTRCWWCWCCSQTGKHDHRREPRAMINLEAATVFSPRLCPAQIIASRLL
jgi:hypothetical protein